MIRKATLSDVDHISHIYDRVHTLQEQGLIFTGWVRDIYPTASTAQDAVLTGDMYVYDEAGIILAAGRINQVQGEEYKLANWSINAPDCRVMVLHTLVVDPEHSGKGIAKQFIAYYESFARQKNCLCLRIDTNERNTRARALYSSLGYEERSIVPCCFNGIDNVSLVCLEKLL